VLVAVGRLLTVSLLLLMVVSRLLLAIAMLLRWWVWRVAAVGILVAMLLLRRWVRRMAAIWIVALVIMLLRGRVVALGLLVCIVGWGLVCALVGGQSKLDIAMRPRYAVVLTCPWGGYGLCDPPYWS
jgi:hypothetical protein